MAPFDKLQELWQRQSGPSISAEDLALLTRSLRTYGRRQTYITAIKTLVVAAVLGWSIAQIGVSWRVVAGFGLVGLAAAALMIRDWLSQRAIAKLDFSAPSLPFVRQTIARLEEQRDACRRYYWPFMASMVIGMNLMLAGTHRLWLRVIASGMPFLAFEAGMWVRRKRFDVECRPLIERLSAMRSALEETAE